MRNFSLGVGLALAASTQAGCAETPPPRWLEGGTRLRIADAHWVRADESRLELRANGEIWIDGTHKFGVDRVGRVVDAENDPVAMLQPDGSLLGVSSLDLGAVDATDATPPGEGRTWLALTREGRVYYVDADGEKTWDGHWVGCDGPIRRTCTLVTHLLRALSYQASSRSPSLTTFQQ